MPPPLALDAAALKAALPPLDGRLRLPGLGAEVTILEALPTFLGTADEAVALRGKLPHSD